MCICVCERERQRTRERKRQSWDLLGILPTCEQVSDLDFRIEGLGSRVQGLEDRVDLCFGCGVPCGVGRVFSLVPAAPSVRSESERACVRESETASERERDREGEGVKERASERARERAQESKQERDDARQDTSALRFQVLPLVPHAGYDHDKKMNI